ncbi:hypothetical protein EW028_21410 [Lysinibacillus sp. OL1]|nr:hypothetical protein EW028_21410 [Lysinibacillus sp. OL1]
MLENLTSISGNVIRKNLGI